MNCSIIIPIYKQFPLELEVVSFRQCCKMLADYQITIITFKKLEISAYIKILDEYKINYKIECFSQKYFKGIDGYNALMLSDKFYRRFLDYEYILIYQLDAYVFSPNLSFWLEQNYDYIGSPWFNEKRHTLELEWSGCFCGGFCLKRTKTFYRLCFSKEIKINKYLSELSLIKMHNIFLIKMLLSIPIIFLTIVVKLLNIERSHEDVIWSIKMKQNGKVPSFGSALDFSFNEYPEYAFELNNKKFPFGCHAWDSYNSYKFWEKYIKIK